MCFNTPIPPDTTDRKFEDPSEDLDVEDTESVSTLLGDETNLDEIIRITAELMPMVLIRVKHGDRRVANMKHTRAQNGTSTNDGRVACLDKRHIRR